MDSVRQRRKFQNRRAQRGEKMNNLGFSLKNTLLHCLPKHPVAGLWQGFRKYCMVIVEEIVDESIEDTAEAKVCRDTLGSGIRH